MYQTRLRQKLYSTKQFSHTFESTFEINPRFNERLIFAKWSNTTVIATFVSRVQGGGVGGGAMRVIGNFVNSGGDGGGNRSGNCGAGGGGGKQALGGATHVLLNEMLNLNFSSDVRYQVYFRLFPPGTHRPRALGGRRNAAAARQTVCRIRRRETNLGIVKENWSDQTEVGVWN
jgi:hypothetical protein